MTEVSTERARTASLATCVVFGSNGVLYASWATRIPDVRDHLQVGPAVLGLVLLSMAAGSLVSMPVTGWACRRWGSRAVTTSCVLVASPVLVAAGFAPTALALGLVLFGMGLFWGSWDVAMNVQGHHVEQRLARPLMPRFHAMWSLGSIAGAAIGSGLAAVRLPIAVHFGSAAALAIGLGLWGTARFLPDAEEARAEDEHHEPAWRVLDRRLVLIGLMVLFGTAGEGAAADWLALFFRDDRSASPGVAAAGFTTFTVAMTAGRLLGTPMIERFGRVRTLRLAGLLVVAGVTTTLALPWTVTGFAGALLWGLGMSAVFPGGMSAAGDGSKRPPDAIAAVSTVGYAGFLLGPVAIGGLAELNGLSTALWVVAVMGAGVALLAGRARSPVQESAR
jgi:MFS family permease